jgi:tetratricopeptide (TPR) repeat protein
VNSPSFKALHAKLVVEIRCPSCGSKNYFFLLNPPSANAENECTECLHKYPIGFHLEPGGSKVAYRYLELALDKWFKEFSLIFGKLDGSSIVIDAPFQPNQRSSGPQKILSELPMTNEPSDTGRLTTYKKGTGAGVDEIKELLKSEPDNRQLKEWLAFALYTNDMLDEAINVYLELLEDKDNDPISHFYLANSYFKAGYSDAAQEEWKRVSEISPESAIAQKEISRIKSARL